MERAVAAVDEAADVVLLRLGLGCNYIAAVDLGKVSKTCRIHWNMISVHTYLSNSHIMQVLKPAIASLGSLQVELASVDNFTYINLAVG